MLKTILGAQTERTYALLRIVSGFAFSIHGFQKVFGVLGGTRVPLASQFGVGGVIEMVAGVLILVGFFTRYAAFIASGMMAVAYIQFHWKFQFDSKFFPGQQGGNGGELALLYCFLFLYIACHGAGVWSVDGRRTRAGAKNS